MIRFRRAEKPDPAGPMSLIDHLAELRMRIIRSGLAVLLGAVLVVAFYDTVLGWLTEPYGDDTTRAARLRITTQDLGGALGYELVSVEASSLCSRGLDAPTGFCV